MTGRARPGRGRSAPTVGRTSAERPETPSAPAVLSELGARFGHDFGAVNVHHDGAARAAAQAHGARAVTRGSEIAVAESPGNAGFRLLLAHELAHIAQQRLPGPVAPTREVEAEADDAAVRVAAGQDVRVARPAPTGVPLRASAAPPVREDTRGRGTVRTRINPDLGRVAGRQRPEPGLAPGVVMNRADTEAKLQSEVAARRPDIPEWTDTWAMSNFDSWFFSHPGLYDFRGREMAGWEVNYYFVSMAMAHQGWDWNEAQAIIWSWNTAQAWGLEPGGGDMTPEMWFAAEQGFRDEQDRMAQDALTTPGPTAAPP